MNCGFFSPHIDHEEQIRQPVHLTDAPQPLVQAIDLSLFEQGFLLRQVFEFAGIPAPLERFEFLDTAVDRAPICERPPQPAHVHIGHATALSLAFDGLLRLALRADKEHHAIVGNRVAHEGIGRFQGLECALQIDDVNAVAFGEDVGFHQWVPLAGSMAEVDPGLEQFLHADNGHFGRPPSRFSSASLIPAGNQPLGRHAPPSPETCVMKYE